MELLLISRKLVQIPHLPSLRKMLEKKVKIVNLKETEECCLIWQQIHRGIIVVR